MRCSKGRLPQPMAAIAGLCVAGLVAGCTVPPGMSVRTGNDPKHADDSVLFRTTYYFRVVDYCNFDGTRGLRLDEKSYNRPLRVDSLYRYTMTGKASGLFSKVFFESGTLKEHEISPFGKTVRQGSDGSIKLVTIEETGAARSPQNTPAKSETTATKQPDTSAEKPDDCWIGDGAPNRRGFQIHGPAGWEEYKQDERLMLVMSSNARPLVGALKAASERITLHKAKATDHLPLLVIEARKARAAQTDLKNAADADVTTVIDALRRNLEGSKP